MSYDDGTTETCEICACYNCGSYVCTECYEEVLQKYNILKAELKRLKDSKKD
jgi:hypothetical protein